MDNAHDHVQAIRLMRFASGTVTDLHSLISNHKSFDEAYLYLQKLAKENPDRVSDRGFC